MVIGLVIYYAILAGVAFLFHLTHGWMLILMLTLAFIPLTAINETAAEFLSDIIDFLISLEIINAILRSDD